MRRGSLGVPANVHFFACCLAGVGLFGCSSPSGGASTQSPFDGASGTGGASSAGGRGTSSSGGSEASPAGAGGGLGANGGGTALGSRGGKNAGSAGGAGVNAMTSGGNAGGGMAGASAGRAGNASTGSSGASAGGRGQAGSGATAGGSGSGMAGSGAVAPSTDDLVVAPDGVADAPGTLAQPTTLASALTRITPGHGIFARDGRYVSAAQITIARDNSGADGMPKELVAYAGEHPVLDFSSEPYGTGSNPRGLEIDGSFWIIRGFEVSGAADNGIYVAGNGNVIEDCVVHGNRDTGLQIGRASSSDADMASWPSNNLVLNCESYDNYDAPPGSGENADGFAAKLTVGTGNVFRGCVSHNNIDDGWDLYTKTDTGAIGPVTIDQCISYSNGTLTDGTTNANGDRNGFKLGGDDIAVPHVVTRSVAFKNGKNGFTWNSNPGAIRLSNCLAFDNVEGNFKFGDNSTSTSAVFTDNVSFWTTTDATQSDKAIGTDTMGTNAWWSASSKTSTVASTTIAVTAADFASSLADPKIARNADMSLNFGAFALAPTSDLVNAGVVPSGALPFDPASYYLGAPDLGAVETK